MFERDCRSEVLKRPNVLWTFGEGKRHAALEVVALFLNVISIQRHFVAPLDDRYRFFQKNGVNKMSTVKSSKRPMSIRKDAHHFAAVGSEA